MKELAKSNYLIKNFVKLFNRYIIELIINIIELDLNVKVLNLNIIKLNLNAIRYLFNFLEVFN